MRQAGLAITMNSWTAKAIQVAGHRTAAGHRTRDRNVNRGYPDRNERKPWNHPPRNEPVDDAPEDDEPDAEWEADPLTQERVFLQTPTARTYLHAKCGRGTVVGEGSFRHLADPFRACTGTFCASCKDFYSLDQVFWADTGESLVDYRQRLARAAPPFLRQWAYGVGWIAGGLLGGVVGALIGAAVKADKSVIAGLLIGMCVGAVLFGVVGTALLKSSYRLDFRRFV